LRLAVRDDLWVAETYVTWGDALKIAMGSLPRSAPTGPVLVWPEVE
jgi:hypothetical protein